jgi:methyltransferase
MTPACLLLALVTLERLAELALARRNTATLVAQGALELGSAHYPLLVLLHTGWLAGLWLLAPMRPIEPTWLLVFLALQGLRAWVLASLGRRWTTRIIVVPGESLVKSGPYRFVSHPNYLVVIGEIAVLPLCLGLPVYAIIFSIANALILTIRIRAENAALGAFREVGND